MLRADRVTALDNWGRGSMSRGGQLLGAPVAPREAFVTAVRADFTDDYDAWSELAAVAPSVSISPLRALDIVGWRLGRDLPRSAGA